MNVAFFTNNYKPFVGGVPIAIENLANALRELGHQIHIFAPQYSNDEETDDNVFRTWSIRNFNDSSFALPIPLALSTYLTFNDIQADVVHVHHPFLLGMSGLHAARAEKLPVVFTYHTQYEQYAHYLPWDSQMVREMAVGVGTRFANCCDAVIAPSSDIKQMLLDRGVDVPIEVIPTGVDLHRFETGDSQWLRQKLQIKPDEKILLFVSRLAKEKNVEFLVEAFKKLGTTDAAIRFVLVGSGDAETSLREQAVAAGLENRVHFTGTLSGEDLISAYKGADLFLFASTSETQGMVVLEAMAGGCPVVAIDAPGVRDVVQNEVNGYLVQEGDLEHFVERCRTLLHNDQQRARFRSAALERAQQLSLTHTARDVEALYNMVRENPGPDRNERFLIVKEFLRYQFNKVQETLNSLTEKTEEKV